MTHSAKHAKNVVGVVFLAVLMLNPRASWSEKTVPAPSPAEAQAEGPKDPLGRFTPRKAVLGFLAAVHDDNIQIAALYLNTSLRGQAAETLARQLAMVLDRRLPARLNELSDEPEGSLHYPLRPQEDLVGTITSAKGDLEIVLERVDRGKMGKVWLFSSKTLDFIPGVFQELSPTPAERMLPSSLMTTRIVGLSVLQWLGILVVLPVIYFLTGLLNRLVGVALRVGYRLAFPARKVLAVELLPPPVRLLLLSLCILWLQSRIGSTLLARQFWSTTALIIAISGCVWLLILINGWGEAYLLQRSHKPNLSGSASVLRLFRRVLDGLVLFAGVLFAFYHFGMDPTAALAGLGVGGIAVALAAQKTLENLVGGISLIADQAVRVGDTLKLGDTVGTVEDVGLRSTRIRTPDRTLVSVPNGQIAGMSIETFSARDKCWFHPIVGLRYETTPAQLRDVTSAVRQLLTEHRSVDPDSVRVRFLRFGPSSLDIDVFAYVLATDWNQFLEIQEELLMAIMDIVQHTGTEIAFPSQTMYLAKRTSARMARAPHEARPRIKELQEESNLQFEESRNS